MLINIMLIKKGSDLGAHQMRANFLYLAKCTKYVVLAHQSQSAFTDQLIQTSKSNSP